MVAIDSLAAGGDGVGRLADGRVVFVRLAAPGDRVRIREAEEGGSFLRAEGFELVEPGPARRAPRCEVFGQCGGCSWQHVEAGAQREARKRILGDALERIAKLASIPEIEVVDSPTEFGYRGRTRVVAKGREVGFRRHRSHQITSIEHCPVLRPELDAALGELAKRSGAEESGHDDEVEYELACASDGSVLTTCLDASSDAETAKFELEVGGERVKVSAGGFAQANPALFDAMFERVAEALRLDRPETLVELHAGSGFFTIGLARHFERIIAVESNRDACGDLEENLGTAGLANVDVRCARVEDIFDGLATARPDAVLLDPPRTGLPRGTAARLAGLAAPRIAYLSCDPATLARDLAGLCRDAGRYRLTALTAFDVFPQTPHVETLAVLDL